MEIQLSVHEWLKLPIDTRNKLRSIFSIPKSQGTILEDNTVKSDGTTYEDLSTLTVASMQKYLDSTDTDFVNLFHAVITRLDDEAQLEVPEVASVDPKDLLLDEWVAVLNRLQAQAQTQGMQDHLVHAVKKIFNINQPLNVQTNAGNNNKRRAKKAN